MILDIDKTWTLFLDRDGVINKKRDNDYVKNWSEFSFINGSLKAISKLSKVFGKIIIVTNQRGVGKGVMTESDLNIIHENMIIQISAYSGKIDKIYYCTDLLDNSEFRKPNIGMGLEAFKDFPDINFEKSVMVGDSISDQIFGEKLGMLYVQIQNPIKTSSQSHLVTKSLYDFASLVKNIEN